eukprot:c27637_g1_i1 orf=790-2559(+)
MSEMKKCSEESCVDHGCKGSDSLLKLFGRSIPVHFPTNSTADMKMGSECKMPTIDNLITSPAAWSVSSHCHQDMTAEPLQSEDDCNGISTPDELGSSSGSNDGLDEVKSNRHAENSGEVAVVPGLASEVVPEDSEVEEEKREDELNNEHAGQDQLPKKPEKPLPCPRCESLDTKFCYFNNYNINQPRHFCRKCQRYWTAGGTLRNVPVGAGRRKSKHSVSHRRRGFPPGIAGGGETSGTAQHLISCSISHPEAINRQLKVEPSAPGLQLLQLDDGSFASLDSPPSSAILSFGKESPFRDSIASASLNLHHQVILQGKTRVNSRSFVSQDAKVGSSWQTDSENKGLSKKRVEVQNSGETKNEIEESENFQPGDDSTCGSSVTAQLPMHMEAAVEPKVEIGNTCEPLLSAELVPSYSNGASFPFFAGPGQYGYCVNQNNGETPCTLFPSGIVDCNGHGINSGPGPITVPVNSPTWNVSPQGIWIGHPWTLMHSSFGNPACWGGACSVPWEPATSAMTVVAATGNPSLPSLLGKHPRAISQLEDRKEGSLWVPKTLRINDPGEAAKSSIWRTLGLSNRSESITSTGIFKAFE